MKSLSQFFKDGTGALSATRLVFVSWLIIPLIIWCVFCCIKGKLEELPQAYIYIVGLLTSGKVTQSFAENQAPQTSVIVPPTITSNTPTT